MALFKPQANIMKDKRGSALILGLLFFFIVLFLGLYVMEFRILLTQKDKANDALTGALLAALGTADKEKVGYEVLELNNDVAKDVFCDYLNRNLGGVNPVINEFIIYNPGDYPTTCPQGTLIKETSIHAVITVTFKRPVFKGLLGETIELTLHKDSDDIFDHWGDD